MIVEALARWWGVKHALPRDSTQVIAVVSFGTTATRLTRGSANIALKALETASRYPDATVAFGAFTFSNQAFEREAKERMFPKSIFAGPVESTIEEAQKIIAALPCSPDSVIVVTGECHSRTAYLVWRTFLPNAQITIVTIPVAEEVDSENSMVFLRSTWQWLGINILRHLVFLLIGVRRMTSFRLRQPTSKRQ